MKPTDFARFVTRFLTDYLPRQRNLSSHTIKAYRDAFQLLLIYCRDVCKMPIESMCLKQFNKTLILNFLLWLESDRENSISTRNQRLAALHAFFRYVQYEAPEQLMLCQQIISIPFKRSAKPIICYLTHDQIKLILAQPNTSCFSGRRDLLLLSLLYDTGGRVQEIADLTVRCVRIESPATITLTGKGNKTRCVPLMGKTAEMLRIYLQECKLTTPDKYENPVFFNKQRNQLTRVGISYILSKYVDMARATSSDLPIKISPHVLRHTKAMHLLEAGVNIIYIRDLLGHASVTTTEVYAKANPEMKRIALEKAYQELAPEIHESWEDNTSLVSWLQQICR